MHACTGWRQTRLTTSQRASCTQCRPTCVGAEKEAALVAERPAAQARHTHHSSDGYTTGCPGIMCVCARDPSGGATKEGAGDSSPAAAAAGLGVAVSAALAPPPPAATTSGAGVSTAAAAYTQAGKHTHTQTHRHRNASRTENSGPAHAHTCTARSGRRWLLLLHRHSVLLIRRAPRGDTTTAPGGPATACTEGTES